MALIRALSGSGGGSTAKNSYVIIRNDGNNTVYGEYTLGTEISGTDSTRVAIHISLAEPQDVIVYANSQNSTCAIKSDGTVLKIGNTATTVTDCIGACATTSGGLKMTISAV